VSLRSPLAGLLLGAALGLGIGLQMARLFAAPAEPPAPDSLSPAFKAEYVVLAAQSYARNLDLERAEYRLALLPEERNTETFASLAQSALAAGRPEEASALAALAAALWPDLFQSPSAIAPGVTNAPGRASPTLSVESTPGRQLQLSRTAPALTPTVTERPLLLASYVLVAQDALCPPPGAGPLIQVVMLDTVGNPLPGVEVVVEWPGGRDHFFTGLKPELGLGYGDFEMAAGVAYTAYPLPDGEVVEGLEAPPCPDAQGGAYPGSWRLTYQRP